MTFLPWQSVGFREIPDTLPYKADLMTMSRVCEGIGDVKRVAEWCLPLR
jgi:hypothetical protein